jgi:ABC-type multidrug transport system fused ATPase/permease subunit
MAASIQPYRKLLARYLKSQWLLASLLAALLFSNIILQLVNPQIMRRFIDTVQAGGALQTLLNVALLFLGVALAQQMVSVLATYVSENVGWTATNTLRADLAEHCLNLDLSFHNAPRKVVGLLGRTGSGKTSLTRLLFRLYDPDHGVIRIAQHNIHPMYREISKFEMYVGAEPPHTSQISSFAPCWACYRWKAVRSAGTGRSSMPRQSSWSRLAAPTPRKFRCSSVNHSWIIF